MKKILMCVFIIFFSCSNAQEKSYMNIVNKEISKVLKNPKYSNYKEVVMVDNKPGLLSGLILVYDDKEIEITVYEFKFVKRFDENLNWDFDMLKKEKVGRVIVYKKNGKRIFDSKKNNDNE